MGHVLLCLLKNVGYVYTSRTILSCWKVIMATIKQVFGPETVKDLIKADGYPNLSAFRLSGESVRSLYAEITGNNRKPPPKALGQEAKPKQS